MTTIVNIITRGEGQLIIPYFYSSDHPGKVYNIQDKHNKYKAITDNFKC